MGWWDDVNSVAKWIPGVPWDAGSGGIGDAVGNGAAKILGVGKYDPRQPWLNGLNTNAQRAGGFAGMNQAQYAGDTAAIGQERQALMDLQSGKNSVSAEQLRQGLQQNLATQRSMAASASPNDSAMAARNAAMNMGNASAGLAGQQAVAGLAERNQATQALAGLDLGARGQDIQGTLGGYGAANDAYSAGLKNPNDSTQKLAGNALNMIGQGLGMSDKRAKTDVQDGGDRAGKVLDGLKAYEFRFKGKDKGGGKKELGVMAQDVEKVMPHVVAQTPAGKMLDGAKLAAANTAMLADLHARLKKVEKSGKTPGAGANNDDDDDDED